MICRPSVRAVPLSIDLIAKTHPGRLGYASCHQNQIRPRHKFNTTPSRFPSSSKAKSKKVCPLFSARTVGTNFTTSYARRRLSTPSSRIIVLHLLPVLMLNIGVSSWARYKGKREGALILTQTTNRHTNLLQITAKYNVYLSCRCSFSLGFERLRHTN